MQASANVLDFPDVGFCLPERKKMGKGPATRLDHWLANGAMLILLGTIGGFVLSGEHRLTVIETNTTSQTHLAETAANTSKEAYEISRITARGMLLVLEIVQKSPAAKAKQKDLQEVMTQLKGKRVSENEVPDFAHGGGGASLPGATPHE